MEAVEKTKGNLVKCKCLFCPSYKFACKVESTPSNASLLVGNMDKKTHAEKLFCAYEPSTCIEEAKGCLCSSCEVQAKYGLTKHYYCLVQEGR
ncbi:MAG: DUF2769 domain-containing protein [Gordonibacter sp.]